MRLVIVPGFNGSPKGHWQHWLAETVAKSVVVQQESWSYPDRQTWVERLHEVVEQYKQEQICLVAHSVGVLTAVNLLLGTRLYPQIVGAILVAPADSEQEDFPKAISGFTPMPTGVLSVPTLVIGSENDPYMLEERTHLFAHLWGSEYLNYGSVGHINSAAGFGAWPELLSILNEFLYSTIQVAGERHTVRRW